MTPLQSATHPTPEFLEDTTEARNMAAAMDEFYDLGRNSTQIDSYGLYNNEAFRRIGPQKVYEAQAEGTPLGAVLIDLDGLKLANDELGHDVGDSLINNAKQVISDIKEELGIPMLGARIGGDEFIILCEGDEIATLAIALGFKQKYQQIINQPGNEELKERGIAASVGVANLSEEISDFPTLMRKADEAMYQDKEGKLGELTPEQLLVLEATKRAIEEAGLRLRDAPKYWRAHSLLD